MNRAVNSLWLRFSTSGMKIHDDFGFVRKKSAEIGHMTEGSTPFQKSGTKIRLVRTKIFQFETLLGSSSKYRVINTRVILISLLSYAPFDTDFEIVYALAHVISASVYST